MSKRAKRNNTLAGILVIFSVAAIVAIVIILGGGLEAFGKRDYTVRFPLDVGADGVEVGSRVTVGGVNVGMVKSRRLAIAGDTVEGIDVVIAIEKSIPLREGTIAYLQMPILGGTASINFSQLGNQRELTENDLIEGKMSPPGLLTSTGFGEEQAKSLQDIIATVQTTAERVNRITADFEEQVNPQITAIINSTSERYPNWLDRVDSITANADETVAKGTEIARQVEERVELFGDLITDARRLIEDNRESIRAGLDSFEQSNANAKEITERAQVFMDRLNGELSDKAAAILDSGKAGLDEARDAVASADSVISEQRPHIRASLANFRLASDQLRDTLIEVRRSPWRLLYRPDTRELEYELLYDAARSYAGAVTNLRGAAESLEAVSAAQNPDQDEVATLLTEVERAFDRYRQAEEFFLQQLIDAPAAQR